MRLDQDQDLSTSLLVKTRNLTQDRTFIFFTPLPTRRYAYALVVCFPKVTPSSPSEGLAYPPQLLLRALCQVRMRGWMSRFSSEGRAGVQHPPKRSNLIGHSWGAPSVLQSISVLGTQPKSGAGRGLQVYLPMKPTGAATPFLAWVLMLFTKRKWIWGF